MKETIEEKDAEMAEYMATMGQVIKCFNAK